MSTTQQDTSSRTAAGLTAARAARLTATLDRTIAVGGEYTSWRALLDSRRVVARRHRTMRDGTHAYGLILAEDAGDGLARAPYYDAPKLIIDAHPALPLVRITPDGTEVHELA